MPDKDGDTKKAEEALARREAEIAELKEKLEKAEGRVENAQGKIHEWESEIGENRKAVSSAAQTVKAMAEELIAANKGSAEARKALDAALKELAESKQKLGPKAGDGSTQTPPGKEPTADEIEAGLTDAEQKVLDDAWKRANEAQRKGIKGDAEVRKAFLQKAKAAAKENADSDLSDWRRSTPAKKDLPGTPPGGGLELDKLFKTKKAGAEFVPDGPNGGIPRSGGPSRQPTAGRKADWVHDG